jgi:hypothetical protein
MRKLLLTLLVLLGAAAPAQAHFEYYNVNISDHPWSNTYVSGQPIEYLSCGQAGAIGPGYTKYVRHATPPRIIGYDRNGKPIFGPGAPGHFGLAEAFDWTHWHPLWWGDWITGKETRNFSGQSATLGTRRVYAQEASGLYTAAIKMVHQGGVNTVVYRANC